jgi:hypothetical protein
MQGVHDVFMFVISDLIKVTVKVSIHRLSENFVQNVLTG